MGLAADILAQWQAAQHSKIRRWVFNQILRKKIPYTGSVQPQVVEFSVGRAVVLMSDRQEVRNHLNSVHAAALMNFAELASGLAFNSRLPRNFRAIVTKFTIDYRHKARGTLRALAVVPEFNAVPGQKYLAVAEIFDTENRCVARGEAEWLVKEVVQK